MPDFMEKGGIPLPNGQIVYLDPNNPDTDGDGIPDGDEIALKIQIVDWDSAHNPIYGLTGYIFRFNLASINFDNEEISDKERVILSIRFDAVQYCFPLFLLICQNI